MDLPTALKVEAIAKISKEVKRIIREELEGFEPEVADLSISNAQANTKDIFQVEVILEPIELDRIIEGIDFQLQQSLEHMKDTLFE